MIYLINGGSMDGVNFQMGGYQDEDGTINLSLKSGEDFELDVSYRDPLLAQFVVMNLPFILADMMEQAMEESFQYNMDEELRKILEEGK
jgi:hypothetical protein